MATGLQRPLRRALVATLRRSDALTAVVTATNIQPKPGAEPVWPFVKLRAPATSRLRATCVNGGLISFGLHAFAQDRLSGEQVVEYAEDHCGRIGGLLEAALSDRWLDLEGGYRARIEITDSQLLEDKTPGAFHWFAQVNGRVLAP